MAKTVRKIQFGKIQFEKYNLENDLKAKFVALVENLPDPPCQSLSISLMKKLYVSSFAHQQIIKTNKLSASLGQSDEDGV